MLDFGKKDNKTNQGVGSTTPTQDILEYENRADGRYIRGIKVWYYNIVLSLIFCDEYRQIGS